MNKEYLSKILSEHPSLSSQVFVIENYKWLLLFFLILSGPILRAVIHIFWVYALKFAAKTKSTWDDELLSASEPYIAKAIIFSIWTYMIPMIGLGPHLEKGFLFLTKVLFIYASIMIVYSCVDILVEMFKAGFTKKKVMVDEQVFLLLKRSLKIFVIIFGVLVAIQNFGINVMSLLAGLGLGGLAFALAAQDTCANFFGSIVILLDRPFQVGDYIVVDGVEGTIEDVGFRSTRVRTFYNSQVIIPNASLAKSNVDNLGRRLYRRTRCHLGLEYSTKPQKMREFIDGVKNIIETHPKTLSHNYYVSFDSYGDFSLNILLTFHVETTEYAEELKVREEVFLSIYEVAEKLGVNFAFPTQTLHLHKQD